MPRSNSSVNSSIPASIDLIRKVYKARRSEVKARLAEFRRLHRSGTDQEIWEEMVFCFFTGGCSAAMGLRSINAVRGILMGGTVEEVANALRGVHRYPNARARYVVETRQYLMQHNGMRLRDALMSFRCGQERRDWLARTKGIKGLGYKEASHFLRNIGFSGYAILDKHVLGCLRELGVIDDPKPPSTRKKYLKIEGAMKEFAAEIQIDFDALDLVLWSMKTNVILK